MRAVFTKQYLQHFSKPQTVISERGPHHIYGKTFVHLKVLSILWWVVVILRLILCNPIIGVRTTPPMVYQSVRGSSFIEQQHLPYSRLLTRWGVLNYSFVDDFKRIMSWPEKLDLVETRHQVILLNSSKSQKRNEKSYPHARDLKANDLVFVKTNAQFLHLIVL